jgi:hypothetical protein
MFIWKDITQDPEKQERPTKWVGPFCILLMVIYNNLQFGCWSPSWFPDKDEYGYWENVLKR